MCYDWIGAFWIIYLLMEVYVPYYCGFNFKMAITIILCTMCSILVFCVNFNQLWITDDWCTSSILPLLDVHVLIFANSIEYAIRIILMKMESKATEMYEFHMCVTTEITKHSSAWIYDFHSTTSDHANWTE